MKKVGKSILTLLIAMFFGLGLGGCGRGEGVGVDNGPNSAPTSSEAVKTGSIATDSWGYTGAAPDLVSAPGATVISLQGHTLLMDASHSVVSGVLPTKVRFSSLLADLAILNATAKASAPATLLCYLDISLGSATALLPAISVTLDAGAAAGETVKVYSFDAATGKWTLVQTAVADASGKVSFPVNQLSLWGVFH
jgi:hypothetical protein